MAARARKSKSVKASSVKNVGALLSKLLHLEKPPPLTLAEHRALREPIERASKEYEEMLAMRRAATQRRKQEMAAELQKRVAEESAAVTEALRQGEIAPRPIAALVEEEAIRSLPVQPASADPVQMALNELAAEQPSGFGTTVATILRRKAREAKASVPPPSATPPSADVAGTQTALSAKGPSPTTGLEAVGAPVEKQEEPGAGRGWKIPGAVKTGAKWLGRGTYSLAMNLLPFFAGWAFGSAIFNREQEPRGLIDPNLLLLMAMMRR